MKILFLTLITCTLFAFTGNYNTFNSPNISMEQNVLKEKRVKQVISYKNGTITSSIQSIEEFGKFDFSKKSSEINSCTYETFTGQCKVTASTCDAAFAKFVECLCKEGFSQWCQGGGEESVKPD